MRDKPKGHSLLSLLVNFISAVFFTIFAFSLNSCASINPFAVTPTTENPFRPLQKFPNANVIGTVQARFESKSFSNYITNKKLNETAYIALVEAAKREFDGITDIFDITWVQVRRNPNKMYEFSANGRVASFEGGNIRYTPEVIEGDIEGALKKAADRTFLNVSKGSRIAIVYISAFNENITDFIAGDLEDILVNNGYIVIDRNQLDQLRSEQNLQLSADIDDATAVSIGKIAGADIIITGRVTGSGILRRLRLRALNTQTAQVLGSASERF